MVDMKNAKINWNAVGYVKRSKNRIEALKILINPQMPSELGREMNISLTHASKICRELHKNKLIECLNDKMKVGRIYRITGKGKKILMVLGV